MPTLLLLALRKFVECGKLGDVVTAHELLSTMPGIHVDIQDPDRGNTSALHQAAKHNQASFLQHLLSLGASHAVVDYDGKTPLDSAIRNLSLETTGLLLRHGADPNVATFAGISPLHVSAYTGSLTITFMLLLKGADPNCVTKKGQTALQIAQSRQHNHIASLLEAVSLGVDVEKWAEQEHICIAKLQRARELLTVFEPESVLLPEPSSRVSPTQGYEHQHPILPSMHLTTTTTTRSNSPMTQAPVSSISTSCTRTHQQSVQPSSLLTSVPTLTVAPLLCPTPVLAQHAPCLSSTTTTMAVTKTTAKPGELSQVPGLATSAWASPIPRSSSAVCVSKSS
eukprot:m.234916 g.234916  ORF g.234916 m.234916 type:complete len:339 (+) comp15258_c2_seq1:354-1370(+)